MTNEEADEFFEATGVDVRLAQPSPEPPLSSAGAQAQADLLQHLAGMRASIEIIESLVRNYPSNDGAFDAVDRALGKQLAEAGELLARFRERRTCKGAA